MKLIFLNTWHGEAGQPFLDFIREHAASTDVFCLMEADGGVRAHCGTILPQFASIAREKIYIKYLFAQATYVAPHVTLQSSEMLFPERNDTGLGIYTEILVGGAQLHVFNFHGASRPVDKLDDAIRLEASREIIALMNKKNGPKIIGGDFNLLPETESVQMLTKHGYRNLIEDYMIPTTRNRLAWDLHPDKQLFADYCFVSPEVKIKSFAVPQNEVSDHLPLILDIEL